MKNTLPIPQHFNASRVSEVYKLDYEGLAKAAQAWAKVHSIKHAALDKLRIALLGIDIQNTFCTAGFELFVSGAPEDTVRTVEFIYRYLSIISEIDPTMDTHRLMQIFHAYMLLDEHGNHPTPGTIITHEMVKTGKIRINPAVAFSLAGGDYALLQAHLEHYTKTLEEGAPIDPADPSKGNRPRYPLIVWPYHGMLGGIGHALVSIFEEALFFHAVARGVQTGFEIKGGGPVAENYSVFRPEVLTGPGGVAIGQKNTRFIQNLLRNDRVIILGQAKSHCLAWSIDDLLTEIKLVDPNLVKKVYIVEDCTSPVIIPNVIDFTKQADDAFARFISAGMHVVKSTTPIEDWPDFI